MAIKGVESFGLLALVAVMQTAFGQNAIHIQQQQLDASRFLQNIRCGL